MNFIHPAPAPWPDRLLAVLRIMASLTLISIGTMKVFNYPVGPYAMPPFDPFSMIGVAGMLEVFGGLAVLIGLCTRPVAFVLSGLTACAYFMGHAAQSFFPSINNGTSALLFCFLYLYIAVAGGGAWTLDSKLFRRYE